MSVSKDNIIMASDISNIASNANKALPKAGTGIAVSTATDGTTVSLDTVFSSQTTNVGVGNAGDQTPAYGATFKVPYFTYDKYGRIASAATYTVKIPASDNSHCTHCSYCTHCNCESSYCDCKYCTYCTHCNCESSYCDCSYCTHCNCESSYCDCKYCTYCTYCNNNCSDCAL